MDDIRTRILKYVKFFLPAILVLLFLLYARAFFFDFVFFDDDEIILSDYSKISGLQQILPSLSENYLEGHYYRPLTNISFILNAAISGQAPWSYHACNILLHLLVVILLFFLLDKMGYPKIAILPVLLLFAISPLQLNAVAWIAGRADLLVCFFSLCVFILLIKFKLSTELYLIPLISILMILAFFSKESALIIPFLAAAYFFTGEKKAGTSGKYFLFLAVLFTLAVLYMQFRLILAETVASEKIVFSNLAATIWIIPETLAKFFLPFGIKAVSDFTPFVSGTGVLLALLLLILPFIKKDIDKKRYFFGYLWFVVLMMPGLFFKTNPQDKFYYWDCRSYLPSVGLVIMVSEILTAVFKESFSLRNIRIIAGYLLILFLCSAWYLRLYENPLVFWGSVKADYPERFLPHVALYKYYEHRGDKEKAEFHFNKVVDLSPENISNREKLCDYYVSHNEHGKAFETAIEGMKYTPGNTPLFRVMIHSAVLMNNVGMLDAYLFNSHHSNEAALLLKKVLTEETAPLKDLVSSTIYEGLSERIKRLDSTTQ